MYCPNPYFGVFHIFVFLISIFVFFGIHCIYVYICLETVSHVVQVGSLYIWGCSWTPSLLAPKLPSVRIANVYRHSWLKLLAPWKQCAALCITVTKTLGRNNWWEEWFILGSGIRDCRSIRAETLHMMAGEQELVLGPQTREQGEVPRSKVSQVTPFL